MRRKVQTVVKLAALLLCSRDCKRAGFSRSAQESISLLFRSPSKVR